MRKVPKRFFSHDDKGMIPRMSWSPHNLYNIIARTTVQENSRKIVFRQTQNTMYQQRWTSKKFLRGYHGEWIGEKRFKRWYLPRNVPSLEPIRGEASRTGRDPDVEHMPISILFLRDVERRLDTVVFRCCFARSVREARMFVLAGKVTVNGFKQKVAGTLLEPGDLVSIQPRYVPMLTESVAKEVARRKGIEQDQRESSKAAAEASAAEEAAQEAPTENSEGAVAEASGADAASGEASKGSEGGQAADASEGNEDAQVTTEESEAAQEEAAPPADAASKESAPALDKGKRKQNYENKEKPQEVLPPGVLPFNLPPFAAPHLFVPPYLEVSYTTCSAIYIRHPTITQAPQQQGRERVAQRTMYRSDIPSPYSAASEMYSLAWEFYARNSPRIRADVRRLRDEARVGRHGMATARAKDQWRKLLAIRKKRDRVSLLQTPANRRPDEEAPSRFAVGRRSRVSARLPRGGSAAAAAPRKAVSTSSSVAA